MSKQSKHNKKRLELVKKEKRNLYLLSAVKTFQERGFHATTVKDITDVAGTSVGNFYRYFESKEDIFLALIDELHKILSTKTKVLRDYDIPPIEVLKNVLINIFNLLREQKEIAFIYIEQMGGVSREYQMLHNKLIEEYVTEVEDVLDRGAKRLNITDRNSHITAVAWVASFLEVFYWWARTNFATKLEDVVHYLANFLLFGTLSKVGAYPEAK